MLPRYEDISLGHEDIIAYKRSLPIKTIWQWLEKQWDEWIDELACLWLERRKIVVQSKRFKGMMPQVHYTEYEVKARDLVKAIFDYDTKYRCITGERLQYILVGQDQWIPLKEQIMSMTFQFPIELVNPLSRYIFFGCHIVLVPNMEGMVFLPKLPDPVRL